MTVADASPALRRAARAELARRAREELEKRRAQGSMRLRATVAQRIRAELFALQCGIVDHASRRIALCCSRRSGKTEWAVREITLTLEAAGEEEFVVFGARTLGIARDLVWRRLVRMNERHLLGWKINEGRNEITTARGAEFRLFGVDDSVSVEKVRGKKYRLVICDEASTYQEHLEKLIRECFSPGTKDFSPPGRIVIAGTPGYVCSGFWWDIAGRPLDDGGSTAFARISWTIRQNPHIPDVEAMLAEERATWKWTIDDPAYLREYEGRWINDGNALVYAYSPERNAIHELPKPPKGVELDDWIRDSWLTTLGADIGYTDDFALVVLGSPPNSRDVYVLYAFKQAGLLAGAQADLIHKARQRFKPTRTVVDAGGQGKLPLEEFNARYGHTAGGKALAAEKKDKVEAIGMLNSNLRITDPAVGRMLVLIPDAEPLASEMMHLPWASADKDKVHPGFPDHAASAALYAWRAHRGYLAKDAPKTPSTEEREKLAIQQRMERERMRQEAARRGRRG